MMRIKRGVSKNRRHKKVLKAAKGYRMTYSKLYRRATEALLHAGQYSYAHRKRRKSQKRTEWIKVISAALTKTDMSYSQFISTMKKSNVELDRKSLAEMIVNKPAHFEALISELK
ncbi:MAG: 50S ribosomal protein L20 [Candidatus Dojkabacteria bacterium]|nr:50S ribosomal protein L20 [Candidatus Dojkabacteria bacterium]MDQ7020435.1 50S ribosomal protein L20 [Candidatus Dojkabacteria bacterium]